ncbi:hypothetical protein GCM10009808_19860 [Microbacterium sediminicola]|uniref:Secreted protein n=1 Tax=Microbacterium sediminicola TaxID=415210 RepID=A0ABP4UGA7_9MICO
MTVFSILLATLALTAVAATVRAILRDGHRRQPTDPSRAVQSEPTRILSALPTPPNPHAPGEPTRSLRQQRVGSQGTSGFAAGEVA